jgi:hypothetical protein
MRTDRSGPHHLPEHQQRANFPPVRPRTRQGLDKLDNQPNWKRTHGRNSYALLDQPSGSVPWPHDVSANSPADVGKSFGVPCRIERWAVRPPYLWTILTDSSQRGKLIREGWRASLRVFGLAVISDIIHQWIAQQWIYPGEALMVALILAVVLYLILRGPVNRIARRFPGKLKQG